MLQWISCKPCTISSPGYFPITYASHIMFCHSEGFLAHIRPCYNSYSCTYTYATRLPLSCQVSDLQIFPFQAEISQEWTEIRVDFAVAVAVFVARKNICLDALFLFWRSETQNQGCWDRGTVPASPEDSAATMQHHDSVVASTLSLGTVITPSDRDGTELHSSTALYYVFILPPGVIHSTHDNNPITAAHLLHWQISFIPEIAATHFQVTPSAPILAMAKRKIAFNTSKFAPATKGFMINPLNNDFKYLLMCQCFRWEENNCSCCYLCYLAMPSPVARSLAHDRCRLNLNQQEQLF